MPTLATYTKPNFWSLPTAYREEKQMKGIQIGKEEVKQMKW